MQLRKSGRFHLTITIASKLQPKPLEHGDSSRRPLPPTPTLAARPWKRGTLTSPRRLRCTARRRRLHSLESRQVVPTRDSSSPSSSSPLPSSIPTLRPFSWVLLTANEHTVRPLSLVETPEKAIWFPLPVSG
ncbi:hypothetical protein TgHK011_003976 [Trichoderma gracile]|nr:hypothetical protein TgHK011_003976 [Trichoderma gracile]